jgi:hypothetical protein
MVDALCSVNLDAGDVFGIFIMAKFGVVFFLIHFWLKYMLALHCVFPFLGLHIYVSLTGTNNFQVSHPPCVVLDYKHAYFYYSVPAR